MVTGIVQFSSHQTSAGPAANARDSLPLMGKGLQYQIPNEVEERMEHSRRAHGPSFPGPHASLPKDRRRLYALFFLFRFVNTDAADVSPRMQA